MRKEGVTECASPLHRTSVARIIPLRFDPKGMCVYVCHDLTGKVLPLLHTGASAVTSHACRTTYVNEAALNASHLKALTRE